MPGFGRIPEFDPRSRNFPINEIITEELPLRSYTWRLDYVLDQGQEGACVGFAYAHELASRPFPIPQSNASARVIYFGAQKWDEWNGGAYPGWEQDGEFYEGTSVLAGAKVVRAQGDYREYRWAFRERDVALAIGYQGPVVIGVNWYTSMMRPDDNGYIKVSGFVEGGHAILVRGFNIKANAYLVHNSWGPLWGINGAAKISRQDMARLLTESGEACVPIRTGSTVR